MFYYTITHARNEYDELCPMQDKALEELGFELPDPTKEKGRFNNRKMSFDAECRRMFLEICKKHGLDIDMEPVYGGKSYLEKADFIVQKLRDENERLAKEKGNITGRKRISSYEEDSGAAC